MNITLNNYIKEYGHDAIWDTEKLYEYLSHNNMDKKTIYHYILVLSFGDLKDIVSRAENKIPSVMLNTAIINTVKNTGLRQNIVQEVFSDVFTALHIGYEGETLFGFNTETGATAPVEGQLSPVNIKKKLKKAEELIKSNEESDVREAVYLYEELSKSGSPEAMYMLGIIKIRERENISKTPFGRVFLAKENKREQDMIQKLFECSAANGYVKAKAELGDIYYNKEDFHRAYEYYSSPGVVTVKPDTKEKIISILNLRVRNVWLLILGGILLLVMWLFLFLNIYSVHNHFALFGWGIPINIIVTLIYSLMCFSVQKLRYLNHKTLIIIMVIIWAIYPLILAIN